MVKWLVQSFDAKSMKIETVYIEDDAELLDFMHRVVSASGLLWRISRTVEIIG